MSSTTLPHELWAPIIAHIPTRPELANVAQVSRLHKLEAERHLYRSVILRPTDAALPTALAACPSRGLLVQECSLYLPPSSSRYSRTPTKPSIAHTLLSLLTLMPNLTSLTIRGPLPPSLTPKALSFPFALHTLCTTELLSKPFLTLLRLQPSITRLTLLNPAPVSPSSSVALSALKGILPNTHALATLTPQPALTILPHRPVTHLHILAWAKAELGQVLQAMGESTGPLRALMVARGLELTPEDMALLAEHLPNLAFLGDVSFTDGIEAYLPALSSIKGLKTILVDRESKGFTGNAAFEEAQAVKRIGECCKSIERVVFTKRGTAGYVWEKREEGVWGVKRTDDPVEVAADLWRRTV
ncbi:hypothetical protein M422DRAFT_243287 [Sphaerobolus stellatus SS14]|nr:hypothetical protein M422DRAFT_243287 [Sphaerobolus stellatus SS14]